MTNNWCGNGPWKVFMLINNSPKTNKKTDLRIHTHPEAVEILLNDVIPIDKSDWTIIFTVGDFYSLDKAVEYHALWLEKTRGSKSRLFTGIKLYNHFKDDENLWALAIPMTKDNLNQIKQQKKMERDEDTKKRCQIAKDYVNGIDIPNVAGIVRLKDIYSNGDSSFM